jgi:preprotein translocase subunit SecF
MSKLGELGHALYSGDVSIDFVGKRRRWYVISAVIVVACIAALSLKPLNFGIEFRGGVEFQAQVANPSDQVEEFTDAVVGTEIEAAANPVVVASGDDAIRVQTEPLTTDETEIVAQALVDAGATEVSDSSIGPTWGEAIAEKALVGLVVFLALVVIFIWAYFREWKMSVSAIVALAHDLLITVGVYALSGFEVTPATVTGFLTILGYSLYDTVVVFDKIRENTRGILTSTRATYAERANLAINQTLVRSINTSIAALLPVGAILYVGVVQLGSGPLKDLALALFVGMAAGAYSSIFIAPPLLVQLKEREPEIQQQARRVAQRRATQERQAARVGAARPAADDSESLAAAAAPGAKVPDTGDAEPEDSGTGGPGGGTGDSGDRSRGPRGGTDGPGSGDAGTDAGATPAARPPRPAARPMRSSSSKRAQPQRQARSKRSR